jgi:hypothetical protein
VSSDGAVSSFAAGKQGSATRFIARELVACNSVVAPVVIADSIEAQQVSVGSLVIGGVESVTELVESGTALVVTSLDSSATGGITTFYLPLFVPS